MGVKPFIFAHFGCPLLIWSVREMGVKRLQCREYTPVIAAGLLCRRGSRKVETALGCGSHVVLLRRLVSA